MGQTEQRRSKEQAERRRFAMCPRGRYDPPDSIMSLGSAHSERKSAFVDDGSIDEGHIRSRTIGRLLGLIGHVLYAWQGQAGRSGSQAKPGQGQGSRHITMGGALTMRAVSVVASQFPCLVLSASSSVRLLFLVPDVCMYSSKWILLC